MSYIFNYMPRGAWFAGTHHRAQDSCVGNVLRTLHTDYARYPHLGGAASTGSAMTCPDRNPHASLVGGGTYGPGADTPNMGGRSRMPNSLGIWALQHRTGTRRPIRPPLII